MSKLARGASRCFSYVNISPSPYAMQCKPAGAGTEYDVVQSSPYRKYPLDRCAKIRARSTSLTLSLSLFINTSHQHTSNKKDQLLRSSIQPSKSPKIIMRHQPLLNPDVGVGGNKGEPTPSGAFSANPLILSLSASGKGFLPPWAAFLLFSLIRGTP